jgi:DNA-binding response OmpR family regulator
MRHISMTVPESLRGEVMVDGARIHLTPLEMRMVSALLVTPPDRVIETYDLIEIMWPNPDTQPETATKIITVVKYKLLTKGIDIRNCWGRGLYAFPAEKRGGRPVRRHVPMFTDEAYSWAA